MICSSIRQILYNMVRIMDPKISLDIENSHYKLVLVMVSLMASMQCNNID